MTGPLDGARQWSAAAAAALDGVVDELAAVARGLAEGWPDARGREWADQLLAARRTLVGHAEAAAALGRAVDGILAGGPVLGGSDVERVGDGPLRGG